MQRQIAKMKCKGEALNSNSAMPVNSVETPLSNIYSSCQEYFDDNIYYSESVI